ncbi:MAG: 30S ribosomal protein S15, partial [Nanoarchaeota archaeon]|nr:30S ribosomal protein S15 [Nanoarchaeota archaeon]
MARMHSRNKGRSGSTKPAKKVLPSWVRYKPKEVEMLITKLSKEGKTSSEIGIILRDTYGIPSAKLIMKKRICELLEAKKLVHEIPEDLLSLIKRSVAIKKHLEENTRDNTAKRGLILTESKIKRLTKYYKKVGKVSHEWKYD